MAGLWTGNVIGIDSAGIPGVTALQHYISWDEVTLPTAKGL